MEDDFRREIHRETDNDISLGSPDNDEGGVKLRHSASQPFNSEQEGETNNIKEGKKRLTKEKSNRIDQIPGETLHPLISKSVTVKPIFSSQSDLEIKKKYDNVKIIGSDTDDKHENSLKDLSKLALIIKQIANELKSQEKREFEKSIKEQPDHEVRSKKSTEEWQDNEGRSETSTEKWLDHEEKSIKSIKEQPDHDRRSEKGIDEWQDYKKQSEKSTEKKLDHEERSVKSTKEQPDDNEATSEKSTEEWPDLEEMSEKSSEEWPDLEVRSEKSTEEQPVNSIHNQRIFPPQEVCKHQNKLLVFFIILMIFLHRSLADHGQINCDEGRYLNKSGFPFCHPCPSGTYIPDKEHQYTVCLNCTEPNPNRNQMIKSECTREKDTVLGCGINCRDRENNSKDPYCICSKKGQDIVTRAHEKQHTSATGVKTDDTSTKQNSFPTQNNNTTFKQNSKDSSKIITIIVVLIVIILVIIGSYLARLCRKRNNIHFSCDGIKCSDDNSDLDETNEMLSNSLNFPTGL